jgi:2-methylcitrate dehydratase
MDQVLKSLADYSTSLAFEQLPQDAVHQVKRRTIDALGCAMGAYMMEPPKIARSYALEVTGNPGATILGTDHRTSVELATFANVVMVRYLDFMDTGLGKDAGHPSDNIMALLAAGEYASADMRTIMTAIVLAYEIQVRLGEPGLIRSRGFDLAIHEAVSSAAGAGKIMGLTHGQIANAMAIAVTSNVALLQTRVGQLSMWKGCATANACRNGVFAALLAHRGLTGPEEAFEGAKGYFKQVTGQRFELPAFGGNGRIFKVQDAKFKYYPADYECQVAVHPAIELRQAIGGRDEDIEKIIVDTYARAVEVAADTRDKWNPTTRETADHSIPYVVAVGLTRGTLWLDDFTEERIRDPKLHTLMQKIEVRSNEECTRAYPEASCFRIELTTRSGERHVRDVRYGKGHPKNPMTDQEIESKFRRLSEPLLESKRMDMILDRLWNMERLSSVRELLGLFRLTPGSKT